MKKILTILILIFTLQTPSQADDIRDFQIEGMSLGDSALDYFSEDEIENFIKKETTFYYQNSKFILFGVYDRDSFNIYKSLGITIKKNDNRFTIYSIAGQNYNFENFNECFVKQEEIFEQLRKLFKNSPFKKSPEEKFYSNQKLAGKQKAINFLIEDGAMARVVCYELNKKFSELSRWKNKLEVILNSREFGEFLYIYSTGNQ